MPALSPRAFDGGRGNLQNFREKSWRIVKFFSSIDHEFDACLAYAVGTIHGETAVGFGARMSRSARSLRSDPSIPPAP